jgi:prevent-host-death family protein
MTAIIPQRTLRNENAAIIEAVVQGEDFIVTRNGEPVAELRPIQKSRSRFIRREELADWVNLGPKLDAAAWRADLDEVADQRVF